jgi:hypothetical protein
MPTKKNSALAHHRFKNPMSQNCFLKTIGISRNGKNRMKRKVKTMRP